MLSQSNTVLAIDQWQYKIDLEFGLRQDHMAWDVAGNLRGTNPNQAHTYQVKQDDTPLIHLGYRFIGDQRWYIKGHAAWAQAFSGSFQQSDYNGNNQQGEYGRLNSRADIGSAAERSIAFGYQVRRSEQQLGITPLVGYAWHRQAYQLTDAERIICDNSAAPLACNGQVGPMADFDSSVSSRWRGPWLGLDLRWAPMERWTMILEWQHHTVHVDNRVQWNLRTDLAQPISQTHNGTAKGEHWGLGFSYALARPNTFVSLNLRQRQFATQAITEVSSLASGERQSRKSNGLNWRSSQVTLAFTTHF